MAFTNEDKILIKILRQDKQYGAKKLLREFPNRGWSLSSLKFLLKKTDETAQRTESLAAANNELFALQRTSIQLKS